MPASNLSTIQASKTRYLDRRAYLANISKSHYYGNSIARIDYSDDENGCWKEIYQQIKIRSEIGAADEYKINFTEMEALGVMTD